MHALTVRRVAVGPVDAVCTDKSVYILESDGNRCALNFCIFQYGLYSAYIGMVPCKWATYRLAFVTLAPASHSTNGSCCFASVLTVRSCLRSC